MNRYIKINLLGLLAISLISSSSLDMWQRFQTSFVSFKPIFTNFLRSNTFLRTLKAKP